jgi:hypothetical protein
LRVARALRPPPLRATGGHRRARHHAAGGGRAQLRLDFSWPALWLIFLDHLPNNILAWLTIRNYGFSDATEIFIFISATAAFVYGRAMLNPFRDRGRAHHAQGLADLCCARLPVHDLPGRNLMSRPVSRTCSH